MCCLELCGKNILNNTHTYHCSFLFISGYFSFSLYLFPSLPFTHPLLFLSFSKNIYMFVYRFFSPSHSTPLSFFHSQPDLFLSQLTPLSFFHIQPDLFLSQLTPRSCFHNQPDLFLSQLTPLSFFHNQPGLFLTQLTPLSFFHSQPRPLSFQVNPAFLLS